MKRFYNSSRTSAGGATNPRTGAVPGGSPIGVGNRTAGDPLSSQFITRHVPMLWGSLCPVFSGQVEYWPQNDQNQGVVITVIWTEGVEGEETSPGRYSHATVRNADISQGPELGDALTVNGIVYDVVRVDAAIYGYSRLVLQARGDE